MSPDENLELILDLERRGEYAKALAICETLRERLPDNPFLLHMIGTLHLSADRPGDALRPLERAVNLEPSVAVYHNGFAAALRALDRYAEAAAHFLRASALDPNLRGAQVHGAECLLEAGDTDAAVAEIEAALKKLPDNPDVHLAAARIQMAAKRPERAIFHLETGLAAAPDHWPSRHLQIKILATEGKMGEAIAEVTRILDSGRVGVHAAMIAGAVLPVVPVSRTAMDLARDAYNGAIDRLAEMSASAPLDAVSSINPNFLAAYQGIDDSGNQKKIAAFYARVCPELDHRVAPPPRPAPGEPLRIGFVSSNFYNHSVGKLYRGIIAELDRAKFEIHVFAPRPPKDNIGRFIAEHCDQFHLLPARLETARDAIAAVRPHILFYPDIGMNALTYFLAFARLAPLQCVGWGHPVTTGIPAVDCFISGADLENGAGAGERYSEKLIRLNGPPTCLYPPPQPPADDAPALGALADRTLYVCAQTLFKIHPDFDPLLAGILAGDSNGIALFIDGQPGWSDTLLARWASVIPQVETRVRFLPRMSQGAFFNLLKAAHVVLDTHHFSGGVSSAEALAFGKAVVTWPSDTLMPGRVTYAYYRQMGITACCAASAEEYIATALRLGTDPVYRRDLESRLAAAAPKLFNRRDVVRELEDRLIDEFESRAPRS